MIKFNLMRNGCMALALVASVVYAQPPAEPSLAALTRHADLFQEKIRLAISEETLLQRSYGFPLHGHFSIGEAAKAMVAAFHAHEVVSQYTVRSLRGDAAGGLLEMREVVAMDGKRVQTPEAARKALELNISTGEDRIRKKLMTTFTGFGLVDVAMDYGIMLLAFTKSGSAGMVFKPAGTSWIGTEEAIAFDWIQSSGGVLEFRGGKTTRLPLHGRIWLREKDGMPLRISAMSEHQEPKHLLRDEAAIDYVPSSFGCVTPASVVHRHYIDKELVTENLYTYAPFRRFTTDTTIRYTGEQKQ